MFLLAEHPANASAQAVPLVLYAPDLPALREHLLANGIDAPPINYPEYMPSGEITIKDPDGYTVGINHWPEAVHQEWLKEIERKRKSGLLPA